MKMTIKKKRMIWVELFTNREQLKGTKSFPGYDYTDKMRSILICILTKKKCRSWTKFISWLFKNLMVRIWTLHTTGIFEWGLVEEYRVHTTICVDYIKMRVIFYILQDHILTKKNCREQWTTNAKLQQGKYSNNCCILCVS